MQRDLSKKEHELITVLINALDSETAQALQAQLNTAKVSSDGTTGLELSVDSKAPKVEHDRGAATTRGYC